MILIPTCTSRFNSNFFHLFSPTMKKRVCLATEMTIIDCHTFYLRNYRPNITTAVSHYKYFIDFIKEHFKEPELVFVYPDWDWLKSNKDIQILQEYWNNSEIQPTRFLKTNTDFFKDHNGIGVAGKFPWLSDQRLKWKHHFGNTEKKYSSDETIYTYDSLKANDKSEINEKLLRSTMVSIQTLL